jgi:cytochrome c peroxidase
MPSIQMQNRFENTFNVNALFRQRICTLKQKLILAKNYLRFVLSKDGRRNCATCHPELAFTDGEKNKSIFNWN